MKVSVPCKISNAVNTRTIGQCGGNESINRITQPFSSQTISGINRVQDFPPPQGQYGNNFSAASAYPVQQSQPYQSQPYSPTAQQSQSYQSQPFPPSVQQSQPYQSQPYSSPVQQSQPYRSQPYSSPAQQSQPYRSQPSPPPVRQSQPQPVQPPPAPVQRRKRAVSCGTELVKGQKWTIADKSGRVPLSIKICVGWDISDNRYQLDASAFMLDSGKKVPSDESFIFYGNPQSTDGSTMYTTNENLPNVPDDAELSVKLDKVPPQINTIAVCVTIYEAFQNNLNFGAVKNLYARIVDDKNTEIGRFLLKDCSPEVTAMVVGELYRYKDAWKFNAVGSGVKKDLADFCAMYGVELE